MEGDSFREIPKTIFIMAGFRIQIHSHSLCYISQVLTMQTLRHITVPK